MVSGYLLDPLATFGENLRRLRTAKKLKAKDIAAKIGVRPPVVSSWENDRTGLPETPTLFRLAKAIPATIEDLLAGIDPDYDQIRSDLIRHTSTGASVSDVAAEQSAVGLQREQAEGPMLKEIRDVRESVGKSLDRLIALETGLVETSEARRGQPRRKAVRGNRR
jgi:transcriptional regulator with XRE-family HTH domain